MLEKTLHNVVCQYLDGALQSVLLTPFVTATFAWNSSLLSIGEKATESFSQCFFPSRLIFSIVNSQIEIERVFFIAGGLIGLQGCRLETLDQLVLTEEFGSTIHAWFAMRNAYMSLGRRIL